jgi:cytochrome c
LCRAIIFLAKIREFNMRKFAILVFAIAVFLGAPLSATFAAGATPEQAKALVEKAAALIMHEGKDKALQAVDNPSGSFVNGELYVFVQNMEGTTIAHPLNKALVGKNLFNLKDADGKLIVQEFISVAKTKGEGWVDYKWVNPVTGKIEAKSTFIKKVGDVIVACGIYKG